MGVANTSAATHLEDQDAHANQGIDLVWIENHARIQMSADLKRTDVNNSAVTQKVDSHAHVLRVTTSDKMDFHVTMLMSVSMRTEAASNGATTHQDPTGVPATQASSWLTTLLVTVSQNLEHRFPTLK